MHEGSRNCSAWDGIVVHAKSSPAQETRALLVGRKLLQSKLPDVELSIRGILRGHGLKVGEVSRGGFEARIRELIAGHSTLSMVIDAMLTARAALWGEFTKLHREMLRIARADKVCQRLMSAPGVGALVALTYRSAVDDPARFEKSSTVGAYSLTSVLSCSKVGLKQPILSTRGTPCKSAATIAAKAASFNPKRQALGPLVSQRAVRG